MTRDPLCRRLPALAALISVLAAASIIVSCTSPALAAGHALRKGHPRVPSLEAGVEAWQLPTPISRETVLSDSSTLLVLGGLTAGGASGNGAFSLDVTTGALAPIGSLASAVHDAGGAVLDGQAFVFGGGSSTTIATIQTVHLLSAQGGAPGPAPTPGGSNTPGQLPEPRSDLAVASVTARVRGRSLTTAYLIGGYDGSVELPDVLATTNGAQFQHVASLPVPVRYPAVGVLDGAIYVFGGETTTGATNDIQKIDPATRSARVVGHLPDPIYGATATTIDGHLYVVGGFTPPQDLPVRPATGPAAASEPSGAQTGMTQTAMLFFNPRSGAVLNAGLLPQAVAFAGSATIGSGSSARTYLVGGEVTGQQDTDQAGMASGSLSTVISLRPSPYGGPVGTPGSGSPFAGTLLIADRGNNHLLAIDAARRVLWQYPSSTMAPPPGGFYFPDDAFFIHHGTAIITNQEDNDTIVEIGYPSGKLLWSYGHPLQPGSAPGYLNQPDDAYLLKNGDITVADALNCRILLISAEDQVLAQIGTTGVCVHKPPTEVGYPNGDTPLPDGNVLISEINGSWVSEYTLNGALVWTVQLPIAYPSDPQQLGPDRFLISDFTDPGQVLEFNRQGQILWSYDAIAGDAALNHPSLAERLPNGLIMLNDDYNDRVVVIDPTDNTLVWQYGLTGTPGTAPGMLNIPDGFDILLANGTTPTHPTTG